MSTKKPQKPVTRTDKLVETILQCLAELVYNSQAEDKINELLMRMHVYNPQTYLQPRKRSYQVHARGRLMNHNYNPGFEHSVNEAFTEVLKLYNCNRQRLCRVAKLPGAKMTAWCKGEITSITPREAYALSKATGYQVLPWDLCPEIKGRNKPDDSNMTQEFLFME